MESNRNHLKIDFIAVVGNHAVNRFGGFIELGFVILGNRFRQRIGELAHENVFNHIRQTRFFDFSYNSFKIGRVVYAFELSKPFNANQLNQIQTLQLFLVFRWGLFDGLIGLFDNLFHFRKVIALFGVLERHSNQSHDNFVCNLGLSCFFKLSGHGIKQNLRLFASRFDENFQAVNLNGDRTLNLFKGSVFVFNDFVSCGNLRFAQIGEMRNHFFPRLVVRTFNSQEFFDKLQILFWSSVFRDGIHLRFDSVFNCGLSVGLG